MLTLVSTREYTRRSNVSKKPKKKIDNQFTLGGVIGIGYTSPQNDYPTVVPHQHWFYLTLDFDESNATADDLNYVGLRFVFRDELTEEQVQILEATNKPTVVQRGEVTQSRSLSDLNLSAWQIGRAHV